MVEVEHAPDDIRDIVGAAVRKRTRAGARRPAQEQVGRGILREDVGCRRAAGRRGDHRVRPMIDRCLLAARLGRRGRSQRDGELLPGEIGNGVLLDDDTVVERLDDAYGACRVYPARTRVDRERRGQLVQHERRGVGGELRPRRQVAAQLDDAPLHARTFRDVPVGEHA